MKIEVNGKMHDVAVSTLEELTKELDATQSRGVAVAVNDEVIPRSRWAAFSLSDGDRVEIIRATQGG